MSGPRIWACSTPVFRYALEQWQPDPYVVFVLHREPLDGSQQQIVQRLQEAAAANEAPANVGVQIVDLSKPVDRTTRILPEDFEIPQHSPWMLVRYPTQMKSSRDIYSGPLNEASARSLLDSPARREIVDRIVAGDSAVWVLIECGDRAADDRARRVLESQLAHLQTTLKLPEQAPDSAYVDSEGGGETELPSAGRLKFSLLRIVHDDPAESFFVSMLVNSEPGLEQHSAPIAIPVFGRGRSYYALAGKGIDAENIARACSFLAGACSCEIKSQNPGADLLLRANWNELLGSLDFDVDLLPELTALGPMQSAIPELEPGTSPASLPTESAAATNPHRFARWPDDSQALTTLPATSPMPTFLPALGVVLGGLILLLIGTWLIRTRQSP